MDIMDIAIAKALAGGGGGGGSAENFVFNIDASQFPTVTIDKTYAELVEAYGANRNIVGNWNGTQFYLSLVGDTFYFLSMVVNISEGGHELAILILSIGSDIITVDQMVLSE